MIKGQLHDQQLLVFSCASQAAILVSVWWNMEHHTVNAILPLRTAGSLSPFLNETELKMLKIISWQGRVHGKEYN